MPDPYDQPEKPLKHKAFEQADEDSPIAAASQNAPGSEPGFFSRAVQNSRRFYLDLSPAEAGLTVVSGGYEECAGHYQVSRQDFPYYAVEFVARGRGELVLGQPATGRAEPAELIAGSIFTYGPGMPHSIRTDQKDPLCKFFVNFAGNEAAALLEQTQLPVGRLAYVPAVAELQRVFDDLSRDGSRGDDAAQPLCQSLLRYLLQRIAVSQVAWQERTTGAYETYARCVAHIEANAARLATLEETARECGVNHAYLCRLFKRFGRQTPYQYLLRLKMSLAAERLLATDATVKEVAEAMDFSDPFHFSRAFKSVFGISPTGFRQLR